MKTKLESNMMLNLKRTFLILIFFFCFSYGFCQEYTVTFKNYEVGELKVPSEFDLENFYPYPYDRYLISTDTFGKQKAVESNSKLYEFLLNIDMINGWELFNKDSFDLTKSNYFEIFPKNSYTTLLKKYPISNSYNTYLLKLIYNKTEDNNSSSNFSRIVLLNIKKNNIVNITLVALMFADEYSDVQEYTLNQGNHFYFTRDELHSDVIVIPDDRIFNKPRYQKFKFNDNGHLEIIETKD